MKTITAIVATLALALFAATARAQWTETWDSFTADSDVVASSAAWGGGTFNGAMVRDEQSVSPNHAIAGNPAGGGNGTGVRMSMFRSVTGVDTLEFSWQTTDHGGTYSSNLDVAMASLAALSDATWGQPAPPLVGFFGENRNTPDAQVFISLDSSFTWLASWDITAGIAANTWYDMKIELLPGDLARWSYREHSSGTWIVNPAGPVAAPPGFAFNYVGISGFTQGAEVYVDNVAAGEPPGDILVPSTNVVVDDTLGLTFHSESNETYRLQSTPDLMSSNFTDTGAIAIGDGDSMILFDPAGPPISKNYRVTMDVVFRPEAPQYPFEQFMTMGGIASSWADFNNDGFVDVISGGWLWENKGGSNFTQHTTYNFSGFGTWGDFNNDGFVDYYGMSHDLWRNDGGTGTFTPISLPADPSSDHVGGTWFDIENDGDLDLYVGGFESPAYKVDFVLRNNGNETFTHIWTQPGDSTLGAGDPRPGRGVTHLDYNEDGFQDIYVSYYRVEPNGLWKNDGSGSFVDVAGSIGVTAANGNSIGSSVGDIDNDGHMDIFGANFAHSGQPESRFLRNRGSAGSYTFEDMGQGGVAYVESYASSALADYDNDGDLDLFFTAVYVGDFAHLYENRGNWTFADVTAAVGLAGIEGTGSAPYDACWADFDNDGDLDLMTHIGRLYRNRGNTNNWLKVKVGGDASQSINAMGAEVRLSLPDRTLTRQVEGNTGQGNQNELTALHFGLGGFTGPFQMEVRWTGGLTRTFTVQHNQVVEIDPNTPST
jgi:hypothetical protein